MEEHSLETATTGGNGMERRRDTDTHITVVSEAGVEKQKANQAQRGHQPAARVESQAAVAKQALVQHALKAVYRSPEVRAAKIEALRAQIEAGTYQINRTSLAMKLLGITEQEDVS
jgi:flagellar biosynthesis anti-sigma factor FlgM